ncbi:MAG: hypothetical protein DRQ51_08195 [Gammaproteobacteria bacterium]|nr:MAG: hypothetical protein DRQ51_08195 [Gammaproteobacteria bacterium]
MQRSHDNKKNKIMVKNRILVTRSLPDGEVLSAELESLGFDVMLCPMITIKSITPCIENINKKIDMFIFISRNAVRFSYPFIKNHPDFINQNIATIGIGTSSELKLYDYQANIVPKLQNSEGMLSLEYFKSIKNKNICIIKGEGGRKYLEQCLVKKGAIVSAINFYKRLDVKINIKSRSQIKKFNPNYVIISNFQSLQNFIKNISRWNLHNTKIIIPSQKTLQHCKNIGLKQKNLTVCSPHSKNIIETIYDNQKQR